MLIRRQYLLLLGIFGVLIITVFVLSKVAANILLTSNEDPGLIINQQNVHWQVPDTSNLRETPEGELILYGKDLIVNTSKYLGPKGSILRITNGMNCQNCHLDGGTRFYGNNYGGVFSTYPKFRERSGTVENIYKRINDCIERSLNGKTGLDTNSREMQAIYSYIKWLGKEVPKGKRPAGVGIAELTFPDRPADPEKGKSVFFLNCQRCHGTNGEGRLKPDSSGFEYPPLWGDHSYTTAAGLYRLSRFAGFVKFNMPFDAPHLASPITDEEAWDVAAFVNSQPRPLKDYKEDWPDIAGKQFDYPFGPYADSYSELQHKYGPFKEIIEAKKGSASHKQYSKSK